jgi:hypothetical protein
MIDVETIKKAALFLVILFFAWNWAVAESHIRNLTHVGSSLGHGWSECVLALEPQVEGIEAQLARAIGVGRRAEDTE